MATGCQITYIPLSGQDTSGKRQYHNLWRYIYRDDTIGGAYGKSLSEWRSYLGKSWREVLVCWKMCYRQRLCHIDWQTGQFDIWSRFYGVGSLETRVLPLC